MSADNCSPRRISKTQDSSQSWSKIQIWSYNWKFWILKYILIENLKLIWSKFNFEIRRSDFIFWQRFKFNPCMFYPWCVCAPIFFSFLSSNFDTDPSLTSHIYLIPSHTSKYLTHKRNYFNFGFHPYFFSPTILPSSNWRNPSKKKNESWFIDQW